jgi:hypothetical protein
MKKYNGDKISVDEMINLLNDTGYLYKKNNIILDKDI